MNIDEAIDKASAAIDRAIARAMERSRDSLIYAPIPDSDIARIIRDQRIEAQKWKSNILARLRGDLVRWSRGEAPAGERGSKAKLRTICNAAVDNFVEAVGRAPSPRECRLLAKVIRGHAFRSPEAEDLAAIGGVSPHFSGRRGGR